MALRKYVGFVGPSYTPASRIAAYDRTVNWFPERIESGTGNAEARYWLVPTPGHANFETVSDSPGRGGIFIAEAIVDGSISPFYFIAGSTLYRYADPPTVMATGIVNGSDAPVTIVTNGVGGNYQLLFASDSTVYCFDTTSHTLTTVGTGHAVAFLNGYGVILNRVLNQFQFSAQFDFTSWDALDVVPREDASDNWQTVLAYREELWLFGAITTSIYFNDADDPDIPWKPNESAFIQMGIFSPYSACIVGGAPMWVGKDDAGNGVVYRASGYSPVRISTHPIEVILQGSAGQPNRAETCTYQQNGHVFAEITIPENFPELPGGTFGSTLVYDVTEGLWHERGEENGLQFQQMDTRGYFNGQSLSRSSGKVYTVILSSTSSLAWYGPNGLPIVRLRRAPHLNVSQQRIRYSHLRLLMETGLGLGNVPSTTVGFDPEISLSWSDDGGQTFGASYPVSAGKIGEFSTLVEWRQLGQARDRIFEFRCSAPVPWRLIDAFIDYSIGPS